MDRPIVYAASLPLDADFLYSQQSTMVAIAALTQATFGSSSIIDGLAVTQSAAPDMRVLVGAGSITSLVNLEPNAYGALIADNTNQIVKTGINRSPTQLGPFTAPGTAGQSVNILIQAAFAETDTSLTVLPYYNAANPAAPFSGPSNSGTAQNTRRTQSVTIAAKIGTAATTGSQTTPSVDAGYVPVAVVTIANGAASIVNANISVHPSAPRLPATLPNLQPWTTMTSLSTGNFTVPPGITKLRYRIVGGGGGGGGTTGAASAGTGGGGAEEREGVLTVTPGQVIAVVKGTGGAGGAGGGATAGTAGVDSSLGSIVAKGGGGGQGANAAVAGTVGTGGTGGSGGSAARAGGPGTTGNVVGGLTFKGIGGPAFGGCYQPPGASSASVAGEAGVMPGNGGSGGVNGGAGGAGADGYVIIEY